MQNKFSELFDDKRRYRGQIVGDSHGALDIAWLKKKGDLFLEFTRYQVVEEHFGNDVIHVLIDGMITWVDINTVEEINNTSSLLNLFTPTIFNSVAELDNKINEFGVELHGLSSPVQKLRTFAGFMYCKHNVKSALYYLKMKRLVGKELELFLYADEFECVRDNFYTWKNGNISALFVIEFTDN